MTGAYRFKGLGWFLSCVIVVLGLYMVSLQVAAERQKLANVNRAIAAANCDIRALETEFDARASMAQLERWNGDVLALAAPTAQQFVRDQVALAQVLYPQPADQGARTMTASYVIPALAAPPEPAPDAGGAQAVAVAAAGGGTALASGQGAAPVHAVALLDHKLLSEATLGDLISRASTEAVGAR